MIRIGIVGCGRILPAHLRGFGLLRQAGVDDFRITALCARKLDDARMFVARGQGPPQRAPVSDMPGDPLALGDQYLSDFQDTADVQVYDDYQRMIAEAPIDAVNDYTTHALHHQVAAASFAHGKHLLTQKPLAVTVRAAKRMCDEAEARGLVLGVVENARFHPSRRHLRWLVDSGRLGPVQLAMFANVGSWWAPDRIVAGTPWRHSRAEGGGISLDMGVHLFHLMRYIAGQVRSVSAQTAVVEPARVTRDAGGRVRQRIDCDADDTFTAAFDTHSGAVGVLTASWAGHGGSTVIDGGPIFYGAKGRAGGGKVTFDDGSEHDLASLYDQHCPAQRKASELPMGLSDSFALVQHDWLEAIRHQRQPETSGREGLIDLACAFAIVESALAGRRVEVDEVLSGALCEYQKPIDAHFGLA